MALWQRRMCALCEDPTTSAVHEPTLHLCTPKHNSLCAAAKVGRDAARRGHGLKDMLLRHFLPRAVVALTQMHSVFERQHSAKMRDGYTSHDGAAMWPCLTAKVACFAAAHTAALPLLTHHQLPTTPPSNVPGPCKCQMVYCNVLQSAAWTPHATCQLPNGHAMF